MAARAGLEILDHAAAVAAKYQPRELAAGIRDLGRDLAAGMVGDGLHAGSRPDNGAGARSAPRAAANGGRTTRPSHAVQTEGSEVN